MRADRCPYFHIRTFPTKSTAEQWAINRDRAEYRDRVVTECRHCNGFHVWALQKETVA